jgi:hypothetical protein
MFNVVGLRNHVSFSLRNGSNHSLMQRHWKLQHHHAYGASPQHRCMNTREDKAHYGKWVGPQQHDR